MVFKLKIQIKNLDNPKVWRKVLVPAHFTFHQLHMVIQAAFGWENSHLYLFSPKGYRSHPVIGVEMDDFDADPTLGSKKTKLSSIFITKGQKFTYIYDFGDDWVHNIVVEEIIDQKSVRAEFVSGKGACPPEDCGGPWGYYRMLQILEDPKDEEYEDTLDWLGLKESEKLDLHFFDPEKVKSKLLAI